MRVNFVMIQVLPSHWVHSDISAQKVCTVLPCISPMRISQEIPTICVAKLERQKVSFTTGTLRAHQRAPCILS